MATIEEEVEEGWIDAGDEVVHHEPINLLAECPEDEDDNNAVLPQEEANTDNADTEPVIFEDAINLEEYDQYSLSTVVSGRLAAKAAADDGRSRSTASKEFYSIENLANLINFQEDEEDIRFAEDAKSAQDAKEMEEAMLEMDLADQLAPSVPIVSNNATATGTATAKHKTHAWAETTPLPPAEFEALRPRLALTYPFELDTFQKQAVMRLERHEHVFVAAHTSAGKTVVAEYAIALALQRGSKAVYTSPIKALSNQKYRDFKDRFGVDNVGIVTGDVSVNPQAQCLIMTTEIFRSMLYKGADTVRDVEYVIFDEVHYVNDAERGVVWEEVIIMLPETVCLVFLSATTPNALDFSDWIGRTKRHKVYLTSTNKRPVPLQHFLYIEDEVFTLTGPNGYNPAALPAAQKMLKEKSQPKPMTAQNAQFKNQRQQEKNALASQRAGRALPAQSGGRGGRGGPGGRGGGGSGGSTKAGAPGGSKAQWLALLNLLQAGGREAKGGLGQVDFKVPTNNRTVLLDKIARQEKEDMVPYDRLPSYLRAMCSRKEYEQIEIRASESTPEASSTTVTGSPVGGEIGLLPVVVFSFSKKKCEELADYLKGQDLITNRERGRVLQVVTTVLQRLSPVDVELPQILRLKELVSRGIAVHHSGLLPLLKELVEMLFAQGLVKVLLATETFAMGVNMPARAVVFNGYRKHDGKSFRDLTPGEYIQMAGRAGRRGLDKVGTVILAVFGDLPAEVSVRHLLTGPPTTLTSQFRLRYNMILNLIRAETLSIEDMMRKSFTEFSAQKALAGHDLFAKKRAYETLQNYLTELLEPYGAWLEDIGDYVEAFQLCQRNLAELLTNFDTILRASGNKQSQGLNLDALLPVGRAVQIQTSRTGKPAYAIVLMSPSQYAKVSAATAAAASASIPTKSTAEPVSALAAARASLMGGSNSASSKQPSAPAAVTTLGQAKVFVLALLDHSDLPAWCQGVEPEVLQTISLKDPKPSLGSFPFDHTDGKHIDYLFEVQELALKDIGVIYDSTIAVRASEEEGVYVSDLLASIVSVLTKRAAQPLDVLRLQPKAVVTSAGASLDIADCHHRLLTATQRVFDHMDRAYPQLSKPFDFLVKHRRVEQKMNIIRHAVSSASISLFPEFRHRRKVLQQLGYVNQTGEEEFVITKKGRVCCELNTCDELLGTEMLFHNVLEPLNPPEIAGLLSALVFQEKNDVEELLTTRMETARTQMLEIFHQLNTLQQLEGLETDPEQLGTKPIVNFGLCSAVYQWARGVPFKEIMGLTAFQEGSIVRAITRLDELCRDIQNAAKVMGNTSLYYKMEAVSQCIKRDIVFAASLYIA
eukprot:gene1444-1569_t